LVEGERAECSYQCHNCQQFGHVWANCKQPPRCLWCGRHFHKDCPEKGKLLPHQHAVTVSWWRERELIPPLTVAADTRSSSYRSRSHREHTRLQREGCSPQI
jgi:hypothetical protein